MHQVKTMGLTLTITFHMYAMYLATSFNKNIWVLGNFQRDATTNTFIMEHVLFSDAHANSKRTNSTINKSKNMSSNATWKTMTRKMWKMVRCTSHCLTYYFMTSWFDACEHIWMVWLWQNRSINIFKESSSQGLMRSMG